MEEARGDEPHELHDADSDCDGAEDEEAVSGDPVYPVDAARVADVARVVPDAAELAGREAARVGHLVVVSGRKRPPVAVAPVLERVHAAALQAVDRR